MFIPDLVLGAGPSEGFCLHRRKETGEKPPRTKERMQEPAAKELYWQRHDPTGSLRHPHRPGCEHRGGLPRNTCSTPGKGCKEVSQGPRAAADAPAGTVPEARVCARGCKKRWTPPHTIIKGLETIPSSKALPRPVQSTCWEHWADRGAGGMRGRLAPSCKEKGREEKRMGEGQGGEGPQRGARGW